MSKNILSVLLILVSFALSACSVAEVEEFQDGDVIIATVDTIAWQCPGDEDADATRFQRSQNCIQQRNLGVIPTGTLATIVAGEYGRFKSSNGYVRVSVETTHQNPIDGGTFTLDTIGWVLANDFEKQ